LKTLEEEEKAISS